VKWFVLLLLLAPCAKANAPYARQVCSQVGTLTNFFNGMNCYLSNTVSGNTIIVSVVGNGTPTALTATESLTCPNGAKTSNSIYNQQSCYVLTTTSHSSFTVSYTASNPNSQGTLALQVQEVQGLGSFDTSAGATSSPASITTAANNEWVYQECWGSGQTPNITVSSPFSQIVMGMAAAGTSQMMSITGNTVVVSAGVQSVGCSIGSVVFFGGISVLAFAQNSPPALPQVHIVQYCASSNADATGDCKLSNVTSGNKVVFLSRGTANGGTITANCFANGVTYSASCSCATTIQHTYSGPVTYGSGGCYADLNANYTTFTAGTAVGMTNEYEVIAVEVTGLSTGVDGASAASALAQTVNYTTSANNEWTFCAGSDEGASSANPMVPGNSFITLASGAYDNNSRGQGQSTAVSMGKLEPVSGSYTCSYTQSSSVTPQIVTLSFSYVPTGGYSNSFIM
jgi:hypothetical protein